MHRVRSGSARSALRAFIMIYMLIACSPACSTMQLLHATTKPELRGKNVLGEQKTALLEKGHLQSDAEETSLAFSPPLFIHILALRKL